MTCSLRMKFRLQKARASLDLAQDFNKAATTYLYDFLYTPYKISEQDVLLTL